MRLRRGGPRLRSALVVPVPRAEAVLRAAGLPANGQGTAPGMPAHVTVLYPFLDAERCAADDVRIALQSIAGATGCFDVALTGLGRFPGVLYLAPEPAEPFVALTHAVHARWRDHPPYAGAYDGVVPHLTAVAGPEPAGVADALACRLPVRARAETLELMVEGRDAVWRTAAAFPLGAA